MPHPADLHPLLLAHPAFAELDAHPDCDRWLSSCQAVHFEIGQPLLILPPQLPAQVLLITSGQARLLGRRSREGTPVSLGRVGAGQLLGWVSLLRGIASEIVLASEPTEALAIPAVVFLEMYGQLPGLARQLNQTSSPSELFDLWRQLDLPWSPENRDLSAYLNRLGETVRVRVLPPGSLSLTPRDAADCRWCVSGINSNRDPGTPLTAADWPTLRSQGKLPLRLLGFPPETLQAPQPATPVEALATADADDPWQASPDSPAPGDAAPTDAAPTEALAPADLPADLYGDEDAPSSPGRIALVRGDTPLEAGLACLQMLSRFHRIPIRRDVVLRVLREQEQRLGELNLPTLAAVGEMLGLQSQALQLPCSRLARVSLPALLLYEQQPVLLIGQRDDELLLADPIQGRRRLSLETFRDTWGESGVVVTFSRSAFAKESRFNFKWFLPSIRKYRGRLIEVLIASFFVQLFTLANPLIIQQVIDKVIGQGSLTSLNTFALLLVVLGIFQALLTSLRTYLFVDTTNRIDLSLGSDIISHLLRLPLRFFEKRPVGELSSRINELENIRSFLTGTALTVVLDAVFSVIYIVVMFVYSWQLTLVALLTIPAFVSITIIVTPVIRSQLRRKAERNAATQAHLVEVLGGIQTVKAQNAELKARWAWQERYQRYIAAGFRNVITSSATSSLNDFFNQLSGLLVLWVGVYMVVDGQLSLGELIAFRIIAGYVTQPLLRLSGIWQNFQQTRLSLERLADIVDTPQESTEADQKKIPMPAIRGKVEFRDLSFRFGEQGPLQLHNVNLTIEPGEFVGIVGLSGSGKSTLMKLLPRLYDPLKGNILIDDYDISKVELYSLRRQIGIVPQDSLLFEGTIEDNISLTNPNATTDEVITAAKAACAHDFIMGLPLGYNTPVGERGGSLSGGQRQRIAIARTILQNPRLLILDEATSALDYDTERQVSLNLMELLKNDTVFFITHRLSTVRHADRIVVMDKGVVAEQGSHDELIALRGRYYSLYRQQEAAG